MKFLFFTDVHLSAQTPVHRTDDYQAALLGKLEEVYQTAKDEKVDFLVCGGDLFNGHRMFSYPFLNSMMEIMCDSGLKTYLVVGQHELMGYNDKTYDSSTLAFVVKRSHGTLKVIRGSEELGDVVLWSSHVYDELELAAKNKLNDDVINVLVAHHLLTNKKTVFETVNTGEFAKAMHKAGVNYDIVLSGDLHDGYDVHESDGMWFCNPGSLARRAISDTKRTPRFAVIEVEPNEIPIIDVREVKCAQRGEDVFGESAAEIIRERDDFDPTAFIKEVEEFEVESADIHELVQKVGQAKGIDKKVLDYLASKSAKEA